VDRVTRRVFVKRTGLAVGVAGLAGVPDIATAAPATGLTPSRAQTYGSLVAVLAEANGLPHDESYVADATTTFSSWYDGASPSNRKATDIVLDEIEAIGGGFSRTSRGVQGLSLRTWRHAPASIRDGRTTKGSARQRAIAEFAAQLASPPYGAWSEMKVPALTI
jgi:hypothetical protein